MNNGLDLSVLQKLTEDPELMSKAMSMASMLAKSDMFKNLGASAPGEDRFNGALAREDGPREQDNRPANGIPGMLEGRPDGRPSGGKQSGGKHIPGTHEQRIKLLEAMRPFVPEDRRTKIDFIIKLLGLLQVANDLGLKNLL